MACAKTPTVPAEWTIGCPPPPGYKVVAAGSRSERIVQLTYEELQAAWAEITKRIADWQKILSAERNSTVIRTPEQRQTLLRTYEAEISRLQAARAKIAGYLRAKEQPNKVLVGISNVGDAIGNLAKDAGNAAKEGLEATGGAIAKAIKPLVLPLALAAIVVGLIVAAKYRAQATS